MRRCDLVYALLLMGCSHDGGDGEDNEACALPDQVTVFTDADGDGYGAGQPARVCEVEDGQVEVGGDCDDSTPQVHPGAPEICNGGIDDDCDGPADDDDGATDGSDFYEDHDGDGYGAGGAVPACEIRSGLVDNASDCDDTDDAVNPDAIETCDDVDNDCDSGTSDDGTIAIGSTTYASIQAAIDAASDGDIVHICAGTFDGSLSIDKSIELEGVGASIAILDGNYDGPVVAVETHVGVAIRGLTLRNGVATLVSDIGVEAGGGIEAWNAASLDVEACIIEGNEAGLGGGILGPESGNVSLRDTTVTSNLAKAESGGGAFLQTTPNGTIDIDGCEFSDNRAEISGGGIAFDNFTETAGAASITDTLIDANATVSDEGLGGGITSVAELSLSNVTISNNEAVAGGGVYAFADVEADDATDIIGNHAHGVGMIAAGGGGIYVDSCDWRYGNIEDNHSLWGAGAFVYEGSLLGVTVDGNAATGAGGGVALYNHSVLRDSNVVANTADGYGGGLYAYGDDRYARATVDTCSITDNDDVSEQGAAGAYVEQEEFESIDTDWGKRDDLLFFTDDGDYLFYGDLGAGADFVCDLTSDACG